MDIVFHRIHNIIMLYTHIIICRTRTTAARRIEVSDTIIEIIIIIYNIMLYIIHIIMHEWKRGPSAQFLGLLPVFADALPGVYLNAGFHFVASLFILFSGVSRWFSQNRRSLSEENQKKYSAVQIRCFFFNEVL